MTERPILFSGPMVRALLAGTKTQTRRVADKMVRHPDLGNLYSPGALVLENEPQHVIERACPYGQPGDRLWVRETWAEVPRIEPRTGEDCPWRTDGRILVYRADPQWEDSRQYLCADGVLRWAKPNRWRPSIHMPRWASRITLEITSVRVERLTSIAVEDAEAEGCKAPLAMVMQLGCKASPTKFRELWESINGPGSWAANPWVWAIEFKRMEQPA